MQREVVIEDSDAGVKTAVEGALILWIGSRRTLAKALNTITPLQQYNSSTLWAQRSVDKIPEFVLFVSVWTSHGETAPVRNP